MLKEQNPVLKELATKLATKQTQQKFQREENSLTQIVTEDILVRTRTCQRQRKNFP